MIKNLANQGDLFNLIVYLQKSYNKHYLYLWILEQGKDAHYDHFCLNYT